MRMFSVLLILFLCSCARVSIKQHMQPDQSYMIEVEGNSSTEMKDLVTEATGRASGLCPRGYKTIATAAKPPEVVFVVLCSEKVQ
jgi:hypothetical protein